MTLVSVLLPTRGRPDSLRQSVASLLDQAFIPDAVQVCYAVDADDLPTHQAVDEVRRPGLDCVFATERLGYGRMHEYFNALADLAAGQWLLLWNDDAFMRSRHWDTTLSLHTGLDVILDPTSNLSPDFVAFPVVPARYVRALGHYAPATPHVDSFWQDLGRALGIIRPGRIEVFHDRADLTGNHHDQTWIDGRAGMRHHEYFDPDGPVQAQLRADIHVIAGLLGDRAQVPAP